MANDYLNSLFKDWGANPNILNTDSDNPLVKAGLKNLNFQAGVLQEQSAISQNNYKNALNEMDTHLQQSRMSLNSQIQQRGFSGGLANIVSSQLNKESVQKSQNLQNNYQLQQFQGMSQGAQIFNNASQLGIIKTK